MDTSTDWRLKFADQQQMFILSGLSVSRRRFFFIILSSKQRRSIRIERTWFFQTVLNYKTHGTR
jgi:hypothetical protein